MGFPVSRFSTLCDVVSNPNVKQNFKQFKQIAIVLNNPRDLRFNKIMRQNFERLDKETGKSFLFITFIKRPDGWHPGYDPIDDGKKVLAADRSTNETSLMYTFCQRADITTHNLPKIILFEDFDATEYVTLPTDAKSIYNQLVTIGQFCEEHNGGVDTNQITQFLRNQTHVQSLSIGMTAEPISAILTDLYAAAEPRGSLYYQKAQQWLREACERLYNIYQNASQDQKDQALFNWMDYEAYCENNHREIEDELKERMFFGHKESRNNWFVEDEYGCMPQRYIGGQNPSMKHKMQISPEWIKGCEYMCKNYITWYNELSKSSFLSRITNKRIDKTLYSRYIVKFIEKELNCSLVQLMRQVKGIPMPEYYCEYYKTNHSDDYNIKLNNYTVYLNSYQKKYGETYLVNVTIGGVIKAYQVMMNAGKDDKDRLPVDYGQGFVDVITQIFPSRNIGEHHDDLYDVVDIAQMHESFVCFLKEYFPLLVNLKRQLRSGSKDAYQDR